MEVLAELYYADGTMVENQRRFQDGRGGSKEALMEAPLHGVRATMQDGVVTFRMRTRSVGRSVALRVRVTGADGGLLLFL